MESLAQRKRSQVYSTVHLLQLLKFHGMNIVSPTTCWNVGLFEAKVVCPSYGVNKPSDFRDRVDISLSGLWFCHIKQMLKIESQEREHERKHMQN